MPRTLDAEGARYVAAVDSLRVKVSHYLTIDVANLGLADTALEPRVTLTKQFVPTVQSSCEMIEGGSAAELADRDALARAVFLGGEGG